MTTTAPAPLTLDALTVDDLLRMGEIADRLAGPIADDEITVRVVDSAELGDCAECAPGYGADPLETGTPADVLVHWGFARACYAEPICRECLRRFVAMHVRHDQARPVVDIPARVIA